MKTVATVAGSLGLLLLPAFAQAQDQAWLHLHATEDDDTEVRMNFPISMFSDMLESIGGSFLDELGSIGDPAGGDARQLWIAMRDSGDVEILNARDGDEHVRIYREGDRVFVDAEDGDETARIEMPVAIADAFFTGNAGGPELEAAIEELVRQGGSDLLVVRDGDESVRLWVDNRPDQN